MKSLLPSKLPLLKLRLFTCSLIAATCVVPASAQSPAPRIAAAGITNNAMTPVKGSLHPLARPEFDTGRLPADTRIAGISIVFNRTPAQQSALSALIAAQQDPSSPLYHQWLTPDQFAARFGMAQSDLNKVQSWLERQGFQVDSIARSRNMIRFSGTAQQVESAFATEMHTYNVRGVKHFAPSAELSTPSAIAPVVEAVRNLNDFKPHSHAIYRSGVRPQPRFTSGLTGSVFLAPGDITTTYDIKPLYSSGFNGDGQKIAIVGQSEVTLTDVENFQSAAGLTAKDPTEVIVPGSGTASISSGDESESDLDLEWSGAIATGANIYFVYTGNSPNFGAFDALQYAVDQKIAPIVSSSYGECEAFLAGDTLESTLQQAAAQGQTVLAASGDDGSTDCFLGTGNTTAPLAEQQSVAVDYPASSPYVTGMGGTEVSSSNSDYLTSGTAYWTASNGNDVISSALQYLPEMAWNDDAANCGATDCLSSSGGGASTLFTKPSWQTGVAGIPSDGKRDVPDLAIYASPGFPGYLFCTSDSSAWVSGQAASCNSGFRDTATGDLTVAGGTSFGAPIFAGMVAIINQKAGYSAGQGLINTTLYKLAADSSTYASAFHDVTTGNNDCTAGSPYCASTTGFAAGTGYDQVTGLGSMDASNLAGAWPANGSGAPLGTDTAITASSATPAVKASDTFTITVTSASGSTIPTGTVTVAINGGTPTSGITLNSSGTATYTTSFAAAGQYQVLASYSGDSTHASSTGVVTVNVASATTGSASFALSSANVTVAAAGSGSSTITVTPKNGYTGSVDLTIDTSNDNALQNLCVSFPNLDPNNGDGLVTVGGSGPVSTQLTLDANASDCAGAFMKPGTGKVRLGSLRSAASRGGNAPANNSPRRAPAAAALAGLLLAGFIGRHARKLRAIAGVIALAAIGLGLSACSSINGNTNPPAGTYTVTVTGQDSVSTTIPTATTTFTFTIQ